MSFSKIVQMEQQIQQLIAEETEVITQKIKDTPIPGVQKINKQCCIVSMKTLRNKPWGADNYNADIQALYVKDALQQCATATHFTTRIQKMIEDRNVMKKNLKNSLNDTTIEILKEWQDQNGTK